MEKGQNPDDDPRGADLQARAGHGRARLRRRRRARHGPLPAGGHRPAGRTRSPSTRRSARATAARSVAAGGDAVGAGRDERRRGGGRAVQGRGESGVRVDVLSPTAGGGLRVRGGLGGRAGADRGRSRQQQRGAGLAGEGVARPPRASWCPSATCAAPPTTSSRPRTTRAGRAAYRQRGRRRRSSKELGRLESAAEPRHACADLAAAGRDRAGAHRAGRGRGGRFRSRCAAGCATAPDGWTGRSEEVRRGPARATARPIASFGLMTAPPLRKAEVESYLRGIGPGGLHGPDERAGARPVRAEGARGAGPGGAACSASWERAGW